MCATVSTLTTQTLIPEKLFIDTAPDGTGTYLRFDLSEGEKFVLSTAKAKTGNKINTKALRKWSASFEETSKPKSRKRS
jgi:hypothetical protein